VESIKEQFGITGFQLKIKEMELGFNMPKKVPDYTNPVRKMLTSGLTDQDYANFFQTMYRGQFLLVDGTIYEFDQHYWKAHGSDAVLFSLLSSTICNKLHDSAFGMFEDEEKRTAVLKSVRSLGNWSRRTGIVSSIKTGIMVDLENTPYPFDNEPHLVGFENGVFDLEKNTFRAGMPSDFVSRIIPHKYERSDSEKNAKLWTFLRQIMPFEDELTYLLKVLAAGMYGECIQNIFILTGEGGNGKDTLCTKLYRDCIGRNLFEYASTTILTEKNRSDLSQGVANLDRKRAVVFSEPSKEIHLNGGTLKAISGTDQISARGLYSKNTITVLHGIYMILCNAKPPIDNMDGGLARRIRVIKFRTLFKNQEDIDAMEGDTSDIVLADKVFDSKEFRQNHKMELFHILAQAFQLFKIDGYKFSNTPQTILDMSSSYLKECDDFMGWFEELYEPCKGEFIQIKDVYKALKESTYYQACNKSKQRSMTCAKLTQDILEKPCFKGKYKESHRYTNEEGIQAMRRSVLMGYRLHVREEEVTERPAWIPFIDL